MPSTIPVFKAALESRLRADVSLGGVQVAYGLPHTGLDRDTILLGNTRPDDPTSDSRWPGGQTARIGGGVTPKREERYVLEVVVSVTRPWREPQKLVTELAFEFASVIEDSLLSWQVEATPFAGVVRWAQVSAMSHVEGHSETVDKHGVPVARGCRVFVDVACSQSI